MMWLVSSVIVVLSFSWCLGWGEVNIMLLLHVALKRIHAEKVVLHATDISFGVYA